LWPIYIFLSTSKLEKITLFSCEHLDLKGFRGINSEILEISEIHFVLSRVFAGLGILLCCLGGILYFKFQQRELGIWLIVLGLASIIPSTIYRTHANKLLYYSSRNGNNGNQPRRG